MDHGMPEVHAAGLLAMMGVFDLVGTTASGWLSDRYSNRWLLFTYQAVEKTRIQIFEDPLQMMMGTHGPGNEFASANLPDDVHPLAHIPPVEIQAVAMRVGARDRPAKQLPHQDVSQRFHHRSGRSLKHVRDPHVQAAFRHPDETIGVGERTEFHVNRRQAGPRLQFAEHAGINLGGRFEEQRALQPG